MPTKREQIIQAVMAAISGATGASVFRSRHDALASQELPAVVVTWTTEQPREQFASFIDKDLQVLVSVYAAGPTQDADADAVSQSVYTAVLSSSAIQALVVDVQETGTDRESDQAADSYVCLQTGFVMKYRHSRTNLGA